MLFRELTRSEVGQIAGGENTVTFEDNNRDGKLTEGEKVLYYTVDGIDMSPGMYESLTSFDDGTIFQDIGQALDYIFSNPWETLGLFADSLDELNNSVELTGSEYIDWKTGGWHNGGGSGGGDGGGSGGGHDYENNMNN